MKTTWKQCKPITTNIEVWDSSVLEYCGYTATHLNNSTMDEVGFLKKLFFDIQYIFQNVGTDRVLMKDRVWFVFIPGYWPITDKYIQNLISGPYREVTTSAWRNVHPSFIPPPQPQRKDVVDGFEDNWVKARRGEGWGDGAKRSHPFNSFVPG